MGRTIVKQPNGKFAVYSSIMDDFIMWDATKEDYILFCQEEMRTELEQIFQYIADGNKSLYPFMEWREALDNIVLHHGNKAIQRYKRDVDKVEK